MKSILLYLFLICFSISKGQNTFYDAVFLKEHLHNGVFTTGENFNKHEDSLKEIDKSLESQIVLFQQGNDPNKDDSIHKYRLLRQALVEPIKKIQRAKDDSLFSILKKYFPAITENDASTDVTEKIQKNPFFVAFSVQGTVRGGGQGIFKNISLSSALSSVGGLDVTKYANAVADLLIERAKQELTVAFFDRFKKFEQQNEEFRILFPKTSDNLENLLTYSYPQMLPALRDGFFQDLNQITYHLDDVLNLPRYQSLLANFTEVKVAIRSVRLVHEIETGASNAADIIKEFAEFEEWTIGNNKMKSAGSCLKIAAFFSESIRSKDSTEVWVSAKEVKTLFYDPVLFNIYMGLLWQQAKNNSLYYIGSEGDSTLFYTILGEQKSNLFLFQNKLKEFFDLAANVNTAFKDFKKKGNNDEKLTDEDIYNYINTSIDVVDFGFSIVKIFHEKPIADDYLAIAKKGNALYKSIYTKDYTQAVSNALDIFSIVANLIHHTIDSTVTANRTALVSFTGKVQGDVRKLTERKESLSKTNDVHSESVANAVNDSSIKDVAVVNLVEGYGLKKLTNFIDKVKPYALFMANMVEAKTEDEVKAALENVILPAGSSTIKKNTAFNLSVQSYLGAFISPFIKKNALEGTWTDKFGVTAPIGISLTPEFFSWKHGGSLSAFVSLLDVGAIVDYRLQQEPSATGSGTTISKKYKVELGQLFSPGAYLVYGFFSNLPLSIGIGGQYGPGLSKVNVSSTVTTNPSWRWNAFLSVDLPLFNLMNRPKEQK